MPNKAEKYIDIIFSLNGDQESTNLRLTYLDINKADQEAIFELKKNRNFQNEASYKTFLVRKTFVCTRIKSCFCFKDLYPRFKAEANK